MLEGPVESKQLFNWLCAESRVEVNAAANNALSLPIALNARSG